MNRLFVVILAGGRGTRMKSKLPKILHRLKDKPMIQYVIEACARLENLEKIFVIMPSLQYELSHLSSNIQIIVQKDPLGTGHALQCLFHSQVDFFHSDDRFLVMNADMPFIQSFLLQDFLNDSQRYPAALIGAKLEDPKGYGRLFFDTDFMLEKIVEEKDCSEKSIPFCNMGVYFFTFSFLQSNLFQITKTNASNEFYLTQIFEFSPLEAHIFFASPQHIQYLKGVNTQEELRALEKLMS